MPVGVCVCVSAKEDSPRPPPLGRPPPRTAQAGLRGNSAWRLVFVLCRRPFPPASSPVQRDLCFVHDKGVPDRGFSRPDFYTPIATISTFHVTPWALKVSNAPCLFLGHDIEFEGHGGCGSEKEDQQRINRRRALHGVTRARAEPEEPFFFSQASPSPILKRSSSGWPSSSP